MRRGHPRRDPADPKWLVPDEVSAKKLGQTVNEYRAVHLYGYHPETGEPIVMAGSATEIRKIRDLPPAVNADGTPNPEHYRAKITYVANMLFRAATNETTLPRNFNIREVKEVMRDEARAYGLDPDTIGDTRSESDKALDAANTLIDSPTEIFSLVDETIDELDSSMQAADRHCCELIGAPGTAHGAEIEQNAALYESAKLRKKKIAVWRERFRKVRSLRQRVREEVPEGKDGLHNHIAYTAASELRWTIYMMRPDKVDPSSAGQFGVRVEANRTLVYQVGEAHARMAICDYVAENGWARDKKIVDGRRVVIGYVQDPLGPMEGTIHVMAPGHGKSARMHGKISRSIARNPRERWIFLHAQEGMAKQNLQYVASFFDPNTAQGRRLLSFYPDLEVEQASETKFRIKFPEYQKSPTITAVGTQAKKGGADADKIWADDYVDQVAAEQESVRKKDFSRWNGTWVRRIRGKGFHYTTTTLWHHEDANALRITQARKGTLRVAVCIMPCGGPNSEPPFSPVWPEQYPAMFLRAVYSAMRDPRLYAAAFMCDPQPDEMRKVKQLAYFLREIPEGVDLNTKWCMDQMEQHRRFLNSAVFWVSVDPSATKDEKNDHACFIYAAVGDVVTRRKTDAGYEEEVRHVARILDARQLHATQTELVHEVGEFSRNNKVDYIICETRSGFNAMSEIFESTYGINIISYDPKNRKKILRLMDVAPMLDARRMARGLAPPVIEFPGKVKSSEGGIVRLGIADEFVWLALQILDAGMCSEDHALDAVTQFAKHIGPDMGFGMGAITEQIQDAVVMTPSQKAAEKLLASYSAPTPSANVAREDLGFSMGWSD